MIKSVAQAQKIQTRRAAAGRRGYAKAVRRYMKRAHADSYRGTLGGLSVTWARPEHPAESEEAQPLRLLDQIRAAMEEEANES